jgi:hypothetical protein
MTTSSISMVNYGQAPDRSPRRAGVHRARELSVFDNDPRKGLTDVVAGARERAEAAPSDSGKNLAKGPIAALVER